MNLNKLEVEKNIHTFNNNIYKTVSEWLNIFETYSPELKDLFSRIYGNSPALFDDRRKLIIKLLKRFADQFAPDRHLILVRAPGRINLLGRHIEHRGGYVNVMAVDREIIMAVSPRDDEFVRLRNLDEHEFVNRDFLIAELIGDGNWRDWISFITSSTVRRVFDRTPGDWSHYFRAPLLKILFEKHVTKLKGMDCIVSGNIPIGSGLSSSSALVVGSALAATILNNIQLNTSEFVELCSGAEWFVGSRGGGADHAAIFAGVQGHFLKIGFFPFNVAQKVKFPDDLKLVIANSGARAIKSAGAKDTFNQRVACYEFAQMLLSHLLPSAKNIEHLRDLVSSKLGVKDSDIYQALKLLPENVSRENLQTLLPEKDLEKMKQLFATHRDIGGYDLRGVALFGIGECIRSDKFADVFSRGDYGNVKQLINTSHNGDRLFSFGGSLRCSPYTNRLDNTFLNLLSSKNEQLKEQPGRYACSTEEIDHLIDIANEVEGVIGAQLAGAGLGGCATIVLKADVLDELLTRLKTNFYSPRELDFDVHVCSPVTGAGLFKLKN